MDSILIPSNYSWLDCPDNFNCLLDYLNFLKKETQEKLKINISSKLIQAIVVPHAGLRYSGLCSMSTYLPASNNKKIKKIIILSTDHHDKLKSGVYTDNFHYLDKSNNKYSITLDALTTELLNKYPNFFEKRNIQDEIGKEHSLLNQLPFISYLFKKSVTVIPIVVGTNNLESISKILFKIIDETTLVVCNTDFSHVNGRFKNKVNTNIYDEIRKKDSNMLKFLFTNNNIDFNKAYVENNDYSLCGYTAINLLKKILRLTNSYKKPNRTKTNKTNKNIRNRLLNNKNTNKSRKNKNNNIKRLFPRISSYYTSLQLSNFIDFSKPLKLDDMTKRFVISNTNESCVSYIGIVFTRKIPNFKRPLPYLLSDFEKAALVQYSMHCVLNEVLQAKDKLSDDLLLPIYSLNYYKKLAVFMTINNQNYGHINNKQRGCIGTTDVSRSYLLDNTMYFSLQSAFHDTRYKPITLQELVNVLKKNNIKYYNFNKDFSITIINKYKYSNKIDFLNKNTSFIIGYDAVTLKVKGNSSVYITNDYKLHGLETEESILRMLCRKMGNKETCIDTNDTKDIEVLYQEGYPIKSEVLLF